jgi:CheY-like chemotaxis protein
MAMGRRVSGAVLIVDGPRPWPPELLATIADQGHAIVRIDDIRLVPFFVLAGGVQAVVVDAQGLEVVSELALRQCRRLAPATSIVVSVGRTPAAAAVKRALESGATAYLEWPATPPEVAQVLRSAEAT